MSWAGLGAGPAPRRGLTRIVEGCPGTQGPCASMGSWWLQGLGSFSYLGEDGRRWKRIFRIIAGSLSLVQCSQQLCVL